jgi:type IV secretion system protein VirB9
MLLLALFAAAAMAQADPQVPLDPPPPAEAQIPGDPRIQLLPYNPDQIVTLGVGAGYAAVIELAPDERVDNIVVGNSGAWQVTANHRGDRVIVKPLAGATNTNMIVLTDSRRYVFMLDPYGQTSYVTRFTYPQPVEQPAAQTSLAAYKFRGDRALFPAAMRDDGRQTTITWPRQSALPATFAMNDGSHEQLVNGRMIGDDFVIEGTALRFRFRLGEAEAVATRQIPKRRR